MSDRTRTPVTPRPLAPATRRRVVTTSKTTKDMIDPDDGMVTDIVLMTIIHGMTNIDREIMKATDLAKTIIDPAMTIIETNAVRLIGTTAGAIAEVRT